VSPDRQALRAVAQQRYEFLPVGARPVGGWPYGSPPRVDLIGVCRQDDRLDPGLVMTSILSPPGQKILSANGFKPVKAPDAR